MMFINAFAAAITLLSPAVLAAPQIPEVKLKISLCKDAGNMNCFEPVARVNTCAIPIAGKHNTSLIAARPTA
ncbi:hypothetical protein MBM_09208 [Drepanopeziza brunnea f. sp. 'multigermtubi' MB_m1]|uniref:Uncharacterized protein n=1 Tax=Marssonina brunnea f. sp. multigermtubi (strain MB_m1) TaxID=1072389 RepID=K1XJT7_MARBU|nr:uncharacterized protein MBM_09208 [Drepanopeziza brunnea f. sp. 'multigermtubi' MB_m1]EKD12639.1 hypothetical protein MBM_09208 [Drepanopeziza brunnea f. sp. 'multigermtubi' MB_m1]